MPTPAPRQPADPGGLMPVDPASLPPPPADPSARRWPLRRQRPLRLPRSPQSPTAVRRWSPCRTRNILGPAEIEVTSFHGITPGASTRDNVEKTWGKPKESRTLDSRPDAVVLGRSVPPRRGGLFRTTARSRRWSSASNTASLPPRSPSSWNCPRSSRSWFPTSWARSSGSRIRSAECSSPLSLPPTRARR